MAKKRGKIVLIIIVSLIVLVGIAAIIILYKKHKAEKEVNKLTRAVAVIKLNTQEILRKLKSSDFKEKLQAQKQINDVGVSVRINILKKLYGEKKLSSKLMALRLISKINDPKAKAILQEASTSSNRIIQIMAKKFLTKGAKPAPTVAPPAAKTPPAPANPAKPASGGPK